MDYLALEAALIARLQAKVTGVRAVLPAAHLDGVIETKQVAPAIHVIYHGSRPNTGDGGSGGRGAIQVSLQRWLMVAVVRNVAKDGSGVASRNDAGPIIGAMLEALQGWDAGLVGFGPLKRAAEPAPLIQNGFGYFPHLFENSVITQSIP